MIKQSLFDKLKDSLNMRKDVFLLTITEHPNTDLIGEKALLWPNGDLFTESPLPPLLQSHLFSNCKKLIKRQRSGLITFEHINENIECFAEYFPVQIHLIVAGAGHVCEPVVEMAKMLGFYVTVVDDRSDFANKERFPNVDEVCCQSFIQFFRNVTITNHTYILLLTRGHKYDVLSLQELLKRKEKSSYIGMIGSRRRISGVFNELLQDFPDECLDHLFTPVGLDIGAETPSEIAVSIMAEILKVKNGKSGSSLSSKIRDYAKMGFHEGASK
ncbi:XdhC family protein [Bacillus sp. S/N-304-OC-R1]|uniref:XdhC family protein n=1 Tax=Bacillus sp. S/N-304-OC-R1 TaxID=2758034 RepID=UPI0021B0645D|nr:XdhC family protein [Bacillus sp. S/N-304-OC-R1]